MKLSFDKPATRKLELWATYRGANVDDLEAISILVMCLINAELNKIREPKAETKASTP